MLRTRSGRPCSPSNVYVIRRKVCEQVINELAFRMSFPSFSISEMNAHIETVLVVCTAEFADDCPMRRLI